MKGHLRFRVPAAGLQVSDSVVEFPNLRFRVSGVTVPIPRLRLLEVTQRVSESRDPWLNLSDQPAQGSDSERG